MGYLELIPRCKKAIAEGKCLGCTGLQDPLYQGNPNCIYSKIPSAEESIKQIKLNLGMKIK